MPSLRTKRLRDLWQQSPSEVKKQLPTGWSFASAGQAIYLLQHLPHQAFGLACADFLLYGSFNDYEFYSVVLIRDHGAYYFWKPDTCEVFLITGINGRNVETVSLPDILDNLEGYYFESIMVSPVPFEIKQAPKGWNPGPSEFSGILRNIPFHPFDSNLPKKPILVSDDLTTFVVYMIGESRRPNLMVWHINAPCTAFVQSCDSLDELLEALGNGTDVIVIEVISWHTGLRFSGRNLTLKEYKDDYTKLPRASGSIADLIVKVKQQNPSFQDTNLDVSMASNSTDESPGQIEGTEGSIMQESDQVQSTTDRSCSKNML